MKNSLILILIVFLSCSSKDKFDPLTYMNRDDQTSVIQKVIRYSAKLPPNCTHDTKFDARFDDYYAKAAAEYSLLKLYKREDETYDFLFVRPARSITPMFEGIGGELKLSEQDSLVEYNEIFRTWKMSYNELQERGSFLFQRMVDGEDLTVFYSKNAGDKYIEFPDDRFSFDKKLRRWRDNVFDSASVN